MWYHSPASRVHLRLHGTKRTRASIRVYIHSRVQTVLHARRSLIGREIYFKQFYPTAWPKTRRHSSFFFSLCAAWVEFSPYHDLTVKMLAAWTYLVGRYHDLAVPAGSSLSLVIRQTKETASQKKNNYFFLLPLHESRPFRENMIRMKFGKSCYKERQSAQKFHEEIL